MDLSVIIVNWNVRDYLSACLESLRGALVGLSCEIIVVDSASSDGSADWVREQYPHVRLMALRENVGFTRGNNLAWKEAQGRYVLLLNPDTVVMGDALGQMLRYMDAHPTVGVLGPQTLNSDGTVQSTRRRFPTFAVGMFESTWLQAVAPRSVLERYYARDITDGAIAEVDWVQGSALLTRAAVYAQIGGLDEGYVMYSEEMDWCKRAKLAGWGVVYHGGAQIIHHGGKSSEQVSANKHIYFQTSKLRYFRKYHGWGAAQALRLILLVNYAWQLLTEGVKGLLGHKRALRWERIGQYWRVLRSGLRVT